MTGWYGDIHKPPYQTTAFHLEWPWFGTIPNTSKNKPFNVQPKPKLGELINCCETSFKPVSNPYKSSFKPVLNQFQIRFKPVSNPFQRSFKPVMLYFVGPSRNWRIRDGSAWATGQIDSSRKTFLHDVTGCSDASWNHSCAFWIPGTGGIRKTNVQFFWISNTKNTKKVCSDFELFAQSSDLTLNWSKLMVYFEK